MYTVVPILERPSDFDVSIVCSVSNVEAYKKNNSLKFFYSLSTSSDQWVLCQCALWIAFERDPQILVNLSHIACSVSKREAH